MVEDLRKMKPTIRKHEFFRAAKAGQEDVVLAFLQEGGNIDSRAPHMRSALHLAARHDHTALVKTLLAKGAAIHAVDQEGRTAFDLATMAGQKATAALLKEHGGGSGKDCSLHSAVIRQDLTAVKAHLARGANPNAIDNARFPLILALESGNEAILLALLDAKPDIKLAEEAGQSPLVVAVRHDWKVAILKKLLALGADANHDGASGSTPLMAAANAGYREAVRLFVARGADLEAGRERGWWPALAVALVHGHVAVARDLVQAGAKPDLSDLAAIGNLPLVEKALKAGANVNEVGVRGQTPLCDAVSYEHLHLVTFLLNNGANPNLPARDFSTPLCLACHEANLELIKLLLEAGAHPNAPGTYEGDTPLHQLGYAGSLYRARPKVVPAVRLLLHYGADPRIRNGAGLNAVEKMNSWDRKDLARMLESHLSQNAEPTEGILLKPETVAERLSVDVGFVLGLVNAGRLMALELEKGTVRIPEGALSRYLKGLKRATPGSPGARSG